MTKITREGVPSWPFVRLPGLVLIIKNACPNFLTMLNLICHLSSFFHFDDISVTAIFKSRDNLQLSLSVCLSVYISQSQGTFGNRFIYAVILHCFLFIDFQTSNILKKIGLMIIHICLQLDNIFPFFREASKLGEIGEVVARVASLNAVQWLK